MEGREDWGAKGGSSDLQRGCIRNCPVGLNNMYCGTRVLPVLPT